MRKYLASADFRGNYAPEQTPQKGQNGSCIMSYAKISCIAAMLIEVKQILKSVQALDLAGESFDEPIFPAFAADELVAIGVSPYRAKFLGKIGGWRRIDQAGASRVWGAVSEAREQIGAKTSRLYAEKKEIELKVAQCLNLANIAMAHALSLGEPIIEANVDTSMPLQTIVARWHELDCLERDLRARADKAVEMKRLRRNVTKSPAPLPQRPAKVKNAALEAARHERNVAAKQAAKETRKAEIAAAKKAEADNAARLAAEEARVNAERALLAPLSDEDRATVIDLREETGRSLEELVAELGFSSEVKAA